MVHANICMKKLDNQFFKVKFQFSSVNNNMLVLQTQNFLTHI